MEDSMECMMKRSMERPMEHSTDRSMKDIPAGPGGTELDDNAPVRKRFPGGSSLPSYIVMAYILMAHSLPARLYHPILVMAYILMAHSLAARLYPCCFEVAGVKV